MPSVNGASARAHVALFDLADGRLEVPSVRLAEALGTTRMSWLSFREILVAAGLLSVGKLRGRHPIVLQLHAPRRLIDNEPSACSAGAQAWKLVPFVVAKGRCTDEGDVDGRALRSDPDVLNVTEPTVLSRGYYPASHGDAARARLPAL